MFLQDVFLNIIMNHFMWSLFEDGVISLSIALSGGDYFRVAFIQVNKVNIRKL